VVDGTLSFLLFDAITPPTVPMITTMESREPMIQAMKKVLRFFAAAS
jgi:hypothetical protein